MILGAKAACPRLVPPGPYDATRWVSLGQHGSSRNRRHSLQRPSPLPEVAAQSDQDYEEQAGATILAESSNQAQVPRDPNVHYRRPHRCRARLNVSQVSDCMAVQPGCRMALGSQQLRVLVPTVIFLRSLAASRRSLRHRQRPTFVCCLDVFQGSKPCPPRRMPSQSQLPRAFPKVPPLRRCWPDCALPFRDAAVHPWPGCLALPSHSGLCKYTVEECGRMCLCVTELRRFGGFEKGIGNAWTMEYIP